jgi:hypothetical protein
MEAVNNYNEYSSSSESRKSAGDSDGGFEPETLTGALNRNLLLIIYSKK